MIKREKKACFPDESLSFWLTTEACFYVCERALQERKYRLQLVCYNKRCVLVCFILFMYVVIAVW